MKNSHLEEFRKAIDSDEGMRFKRNILVAISAIFIALNCSGAVLKEANTFIFKIEFTNQFGLSYFMVLTIFFLTIRYYGYAQYYHDKLFQFWAERMMNDYRVFRVDGNEKEIHGLLSKFNQLNPFQETETDFPTYNVVGIFKRSLVYGKKANDLDGPFDFDEEIELFRFTKKWGINDYIKILIIEAKYQLGAFLRYRENLDLLSPYIISCLSIISFFYKDIFLAS